MGTSIVALTIFGRWRVVGFSGESTRSSFREFVNDRVPAPHITERMAHFPSHHETCHEKHLDEELFFEMHIWIEQPLVHLQDLPTCDVVPYQTWRY